MLKVLLADDEPYILQGMSVLTDWEKEGFEIAAAVSNGKEALDFIRNNEVHLIIADIKMPEMNGLELLTAIRKEKLTDADFVLLSGYDDFAYAQQAIRQNCLDYLLKPINQEALAGLLRTVAKRYQYVQQEKNRSNEKEQAYLARQVIALLSGKYDAGSLQYLKKQLVYSEGVRYIHIELECRTAEERNKREVLGKVYQYCRSYVGEAYQKHCIFDVANDREEYSIGFLYCNAMARERGISEQEYFDQLLAGIRQQTGETVAFYVGSVAGTLEELADSYRTAAVARSFRAFCPEGRIHYYEEKSSKEGLVLCKKILDDLLSAIGAGQPDAISRSIELFYREMNRIGMDEGSVEININYLLFQLIHLATEQDGEVNQEEILHKISRNVFQSGTMWGSMEQLTEFANEYGRYLAQLRHKVSGGVLSSIERDMREHFRENLSLKELSQKYYLNSAYLGQIFRKKYGMAFRDYLNLLRMQEAKRLLLYSDKKVVDIAEEVGYQNLDYFINRFISSFGCTPSKYRKQMRSDS